jgi:hypothetical protein
MWRDLRSTGEDNLNQCAGIYLPILGPEADLVWLSKWIDKGNEHRDPEAVTWGRLAKVAEEAGEVISAYIGATGQNPRKGVTNDMDKVIQELLDVAVTALGAIEHLTDHQGEALALLEDKLHRLYSRANGLDL